MRYKALLTATAIKIMWHLFPSAVIGVSCIINRQLLHDFWPFIFLAVFLFALARIIVAIGNYLSELYIDNEVIRLTIFKTVQEIHWRNALAVEIREPLIGSCLLVVKGEEENIFYPLSDLTPADREAIKQHIDSLPGYNRVQ